jgi:hypothetical protein
MRRAKVFEDTTGKFFDKYTIVIDKEVYSMSENALSPQGVNQYCGGVELCKDFAHSRGFKRVRIQNLSDEVKKAIRERIKEV